MNLAYIEHKLKKRLSYSYIWGRKQSNDWGRLTNFIYNIDNFNELLSEILNMDEDIKNYTMNRWYNFWSAKAVEYMFASHSNVVRNTNPYDKLVDFKISHIPFDHKTSVFPKGFKKSFEYARQNSKKLIEWLYENQSQQGRKHLKNRLFIVIYESEYKKHWKLKAEIRLLKKAIDKYLNNFDVYNLYELNFENSVVYSDIIWVER